MKTPDLDISSLPIDGWKEMDKELDIFDVLSKALYRADELYDWENIDDYKMLVKSCFKQICKERLLSDKVVLTIDELRHMKKNFYDDMSERAWNDAVSWNECIDEIISRKKNV